MVHSFIGGLHLAMACVAMTFGLAVLSLPKGTLLHRILGYVWVIAMVFTNASALSIYQLTGSFEPFHALALISLVCILAGVAAPILRWRNWLGAHFRFMTFGYLGLLAAACAELSTRSGLVPLHSAWQVIGFGTGVGAVFAIAGAILIPRLSRTAQRLARAQR